MTVSGAAGRVAEKSPQEEPRRAFPINAQSGSESEVELDNNITVSNRNELLDFLQPQEDQIAASSLCDRYYDSLQVLKRKNKQCLLELGLKYQVKLKKNHNPSRKDKELEDFFQDNRRLISPTKFPKGLRSGNIRGCKSLTDISSDTSDDEQNHYSFLPACSKPKSASAAWISSVTIPQPFKMTLQESHRKSQVLKSHALLEIDSATYKKQSQEDAECQKQFRAQPAPAHIYLPLYQEIMEKNKIRRQVETQKRRELLLSMQKPFRFQEKEEKKKDAVRQAVLDVLTPAKKTVPMIRKKIPTSTYEPMFGDKLKEAELLRKICIQLRAKELLENSWAPIELGNKQRAKESRIASKNREQKLSFLQVNFSFKPRINTSVPDFEGLYWAFQREALSKRKIKEATRNKPFRLRTANLHCKHKMPEKAITQSSKAPVQRSRSVACLSSLAANTLPIYITDAVRKRENAIKLSQENKNYKENEGVCWAELQRKKCQAMHKSVNCRAKAMDPSKSLEETHKEKLKQNWQNGQKRMREYKKELEEMKMRVKNRPYLFEQVTTHSARQGAQKLFRETLQQCGLNEEFVRKKGGKAIDLTGKQQQQPPESKRNHRFESYVDDDIIKQLSQEGQKRLELK